MYGLQLKEKLVNSLNSRCHR